MSKAENDLLNIENNLAGDRVPWDTICFHAQQAAEKLLKAFLVYNGRQSLRTHDLIALLTNCAEVDAGLAALQDDCQKLTYYGVSSRYPDDVYEPNEEDARETIARCQRIRSAILARLPKVA